MSNTISKGLVDLKQLNSELLRENEVLVSIMSEDWDKEGPNTVEEHYAKLKTEYDPQKAKVDKLIAHITTLKSLINKANSDVGVNDLLIKLNYIKVQLSTLMKIYKNTSSFRSSINMNVAKYSEIPSLISELEKEKTDVENKIHYLNHNTEL